MIVKMLERCHRILNRLRIFRWTATSENHLAILSAHGDAVSYWRRTGTDQFIRHLN